MSTRVRLRTYIVFADALTGSEPYDVAGAFALLQDVENALAPAGLKSVDVAIRAHLAAALSRKSPAFALARHALVRMTEDMELRLAAKAV